ncbi:sigma factor-like helix-turn-helix DNA-binding protein [Streptomyces albireticuli]|uniref:sigma factor-like helix-turn-helix DNA-binding protein n=1 Tax=Streptomyces albireticuli TaxID=1940 RepID=UPI0026AA14B7
MRERRAAGERRRAHEFEEFVAGAGGRLLHVAALLTGEAPGRTPAGGGPGGLGDPTKGDGRGRSGAPAAESGSDDPTAGGRPGGPTAGSGSHRPRDPAPGHGHGAAERLLTAALAATYAAWDPLRGEDPYDRARQELVTRYARTARRAGGTAPGGVLAPLAPQERLVVVLRLAEGLAEEQTAALLGLPVERVRTLCTRSVDALRHGAPGADRAGAPAWRAGWWRARPWRTGPWRAGP